MSLVRKFLRGLHRSQSGGAILEFAMVMPILLSLSFAGFEFSRSLKIVQIGSTLSREAANLAFRRCVAESGTELNTCLQNVADETVNFSRVAVPNVTIILSLWLHDPSKPLETRTDRLSIAASTSSNTFTGGQVALNNNKLCNAAVPDVNKPFSRICKQNSNGTEIKFRNIDGAGSSSTAFTPAAILANHRLLIIAESYIEYQPVVGVIGKILNIQGQRYYDATML